VLNAEGLREEFHQSYPLSPNGRVILRNLNGAVRVTGWDRAEVQVSAVKKAETQQALDETHIEINASGDMIDIRTRYPEGERRNAPSVDYTISVPRTAVLEKINTVNGSVRIEGVAGPVKAGSVNGAVEVKGALGELDLSSVNGRVLASFDQTLAQDVRLHTVNGAVDIALPPNAGAQLVASTVHGSIDSEFDLPVRRVKFGPGSDIRATIGGGGPQVKLNTVNGSIHLRRR